ncbi:hypothetical protein [Marinomonas sp. 2405UD68-3]
MNQSEAPDIHSMLGNAQQASHFLKALGNEKHTADSINEKNH